MENGFEGDEAEKLAFEAVKKQKVRAYMVKFAQDKRLDSQTSKLIANIAEGEFERVYDLVETIRMEEKRQSDPAYDAPSGISRLLPWRSPEKEIASKSHIRAEKIQNLQAKLGSILLDHVPGHPGGGEDLVTALSAVFKLHGTIPNQIIRENNPESLA